ncbi:type IV pilus assembly protein PilV [Rhodanobacter sp. TND4EL1]
MNRASSLSNDSLRTSANGRRLLVGVRNREAGVGLIEVLVAVLVLSIGFLGVAALQALSLSTNNSAMARSMATIDSYSILDAMRADAASARAGAYNGSPAVTAGACPAAATGSLSNTQLIQWCTQLGSDLGNTAATTGSINCGATGACTITIKFDDSRAGAGGTNAQTITTTAML